MSFHVVSRQYISFLLRSYIILIIIFIEFRGEGLLIVSIQTLKSFLQLLDYEDLSFVSYDKVNQLAYFDGFLDTYYRIMCLIKADGTIEVHDTTFDVDNYVFIATIFPNDDQPIIRYE